MDIFQRVILAVLVMLPLLASAADEQIPANHKLWVFQAVGSGYTGALNGPDPEALCTPWLAWYTAQGNSGYGYIPAAGAQTDHRTYGCRATHPNLPGYHNLTYLNLYVSCTGNNGTWIRQNQNEATPVMCTVPACVAPDVRKPDGSCGPPDCEPGCNGACGQQKVYNRLRTLTCINLCIYRLGGGMEIELTNGHSRAFMTVQENTGQACTPAEEEPTTPDPQPCPECACQEQGKSYVVMAGVATCVEPGTPGSEPVKKQDPPKIETTTPAPTPENPNPDPVETVTPSPIITITPAPPGSPPGTGPTVTETTTNPDGSTTSTAQGQDSFCQANPNHALCKADDAKKFCEENPDVLACQKLDEPGEGEAIGEKTIDLGFSPVDVPGATGGSCPAPVTISIGGRSASLSWDWLCQYAAGIKPAVLAVAWLSAALIVFGAVRERD